MNVKKGCTAVLSVSLFLCAAWALPLQAASIHGDEPSAGKPADIGFKGQGLGEDPFGKLVSEEAKYDGLADIELFEERDLPAGKGLDHAPGGKWENGQAHLDDGKWEDHKNGLPGPIDNPGYLKEHPSAVPVPAAIWLLGSGLAGLLGLSRRRVR